MTSENQKPKDEPPRIVSKIFGKDYEGPFSDWDEYHAAEYGLGAGVAVGYSGSWAVASAIVPVALGRAGADGGQLPKNIVRQIRAEGHYFLTAFALGIVLGSFARVRAIDISAIPLPGGFGA